MSIKKLLLLSTLAMAVFAAGCGKKDEEPSTTDTSKPAAGKTPPAGSGSSGAATPPTKGEVLPRPPK
jgi:hypothetical protein